MLRGHHRPVSACAAERQQLAVSGGMKVTTGSVGHSGNAGMSWWIAGRETLLERFVVAFLLHRNFLLRQVPELFRSSFWTAGFLPQSVGSFPDTLFINAWWDG